MSAIGNRRGFLRQLATLPLIGGGVTLIGQPKAVAEPVTEQLMRTYRQWLSLERYRADEWFPPSPDRVKLFETAHILDRSKPGFEAEFKDAMSFEFHVKYSHPRTPAADFHCTLDGVIASPSPTTRAALVLSAVGCNWREG